MADTDLAPSNTQLQQSDNSSLLTLKEIAERLGVSYGRLRGFADTPGVGEYVGAVSVAGVKGVRYHADAETHFARLIQAQDEGVVTPKTARAYLQNVQVTAIAPLQQSGIAPRDTPIAALSQTSNDLLMTLLGRIVTGAEDRLLTAVEAAAYLACKPRSVSRYVRPVRPGVYRHSDIQHYIAALSQR